MGYQQPIDSGIHFGDITLMKQKHEVFPYGEMVRIFWGGAWFYYANHAFEAAPMNRIFNLIGPVTMNVRLPVDWYAEFTINSIIEDASTNFEFWDGDNHFRDKHRAHGEGARVEIYGYWPDMIVGNPNGMLRCLWWGMLGQPDRSDTKRFNVSAKAGVRSPKLELPRRIIYPGCPRIFGGQTNPATNAPYLTDQEQIDDHACPYNRHIGGSVGNLNGGVPFTSCPRNSLAVCEDRLGVSEGYKYYGGFDLIKATATVEGKHHSYQAATAANPSILRHVVPLIYGVAMVSDVEALVWQNQAQTPNGYIPVMWPLCEGQIEGTYPDQGIFYIKVNDVWIVGHQGMARGDYGATLTIPGFTKLGYSRTAYFWTDLPYKDFPDFSVQDIRASCLANGLRIRVYSTPTTHTTQWSANRAWCTFDAITSKVYGWGFDRGLFEMDDWLQLAAWHNQLLNGILTLSYDTGTGEITHAEGYKARSTLNLYLKEKAASEVLKNICSAGQFSTPFFWNGQIRVVGLGLQDMVTYIPQQFTQQPEINGFINIKKGTLKYNQKSDEELINQLQVKFVEQLFPYNTGSFITGNDTQWGVPPLFVEQGLVYDDQIQQLRAGLAMGDSTLHVTKGSFDAFGINNYHEASRMGALIFDLGEQERGGLANNLTVNFTTWFPSSDGIQLHPYKIIQIFDTELQEYEETPGHPFIYFRILKLTRKGDLTLEVEAQAYPYEYYKAVEAGNYIRPLPVITRGIPEPRILQRPVRPTPGDRNRDGRGVIIKES